MFPATRNKIYLFKKKRFYVTECFKMDPFAKTNFTVTEVAEAVTHLKSGISFNLTLTILIACLGLIFVGLLAVLEYKIFKGRRDRNKQPTELSTIIRNGVRQQAA